jgi:hypothetical protein
MSDEQLQLFEAVEPVVSVIFFGCPMAQNRRAMGYLLLHYFLQFVDSPSGYFP